MYEEEDKSRNVKMTTWQPPSTTWLLCEKNYVKEIIQKER